MTVSDYSFEDFQFMALAIQLAKRGHYTTSPNPRVGCVLVKNGQVIGKGFHQKAGEGHAEVNALAQAGESAKGAIAYVTLEPCSHFGRTPPCAQALIDAKVAKVIAAMEDPNPQVSGRGIALLREAGIEVHSGLLAADARELNLGFIKRMTKKLPRVTCKLAASLDGKTAMANGESQWITSPEARQDVQRLRAQSCGIISGADSIITDNARMTVRWSELGGLKAEYPEASVRQPTRIIIDSKNRLTPDLALFKQHNPVILVRTQLETRHQWPHFVEQLIVNERNGYADLHDLLAILAERGFNEILVESGAQLVGAFIGQDLADELVLYQAAKLLGADGQSLVALPQVQSLAAAKTLVIKSLGFVGPDIKIIAAFEES